MPTVSLENMQGEEDNNSDDGRLFLIFVHAGRQAVDGDSAVTGEGDLDGEEERPLFPIDPTRKKDTFCADE
jgi:hypothetical protein